MANIHRIQEYENQGQGAGREEYARRQQRAGTPLLGGMAMPNRTMSDPRKENVWDMFTQCCCPSFTIVSFIVVVTIIDIILYIFTLCYGLNNSFDAGFLAPTLSTLDDFGDKVYIYIYYNIFHI